MQLRSVSIHKNIEWKIRWDLFILSMNYFDSVAISGIRRCNWNISQVRTFKTMRFEKEMRLLHHFCRSLSFLKKKKWTAFCELCHHVFRAWPRDVLSHCAILLILKYDLWSLRLKTLKLNGRRTLRKATKSNAIDFIATLL